MSTSGQTVAVVLGIGALVGLGAWLVITLMPTEEARQRGARAAARRRDADQRLVTAWDEIARTGWIPAARRRLAAEFAFWYRAVWINTGRTGSRLPTAIKIPLYGNWCGPNYGSGPCLDEIDCACRDHDLAYAHADRIEAGLA